MNKAERREVMRKIGSIGGKATGPSKARSPSQASAAAKARWAKAKLGQIRQNIDAAIAHKLKERKQQ